jgi:hypothetical protein
MPLHSEWVRVDPAFRWIRRFFLRRERNYGHGHGHWHWHWHW